MKSRKQSVHNQMTRLPLVFCETRPSLLSRRGRGCSEWVLLMPPHHVLQHRSKTVAELRHHVCLKQKPTVVCAAPSGLRQGTALELMYHAPLGQKDFYCVGTTKQCVSCKSIDPSLLSSHDYTAGACSGLSVSLSPSAHIKCVTV